MCDWGEIPGKMPHGCCLAPFAQLLVDSLAASYQQEANPQMQVHEIEYFHKPICMLLQEILRTARAEVCYTNRLQSLAYLLGT